MQNKSEELLLWSTPIYSLYKDAIFDVRVLATEEEIKSLIDFGVLSPETQRIVGMDRISEDLVGFTQTMFGKKEND